jgi:hypothetical protein
MWAMASESIPSSRRQVFHIPLGSSDHYSRSHAFYYIFSAFYVAELLASFLASVTIDISPWIASGMAMASVISCLLLLWIIPQPKLDTKMHSATLLGNSNETARTSESSNKGRSVDTLLSVFSNTKVLLTIPVFLVGIFRYTTLNVLIQYASVRFHLKISTGAMFYTETALVNIFLFLFMIPRLTAYIRKKYSVRPQRIDLFLVRSSVLLMCCGSLGIGLSWSGKLLPAGKFLASQGTQGLVYTDICEAVFVFAAGFGSRVSALSLVSYWISDDAKATMYAAIAVLESLGHFIGDPSMQQILAASLRLSPFWQALPFFVGSVGA